MSDSNGEQILPGNVTMAEERNAEIDLVSMSQLVTRAKQGDKQAENAICKQVERHLTQQAAMQIDRIRRNKMQASDIVQLTMTRMIVGFADFRGSTSAEFYSWVNAILKNEVLTLNRDMHRHRRDVRREQPLEVVGPEFAKALNQESPETVLLRTEKLKRFREVLKHLPPDYATIIELRGLREMPFKEVAESMNRSVDAVTKLWTRALVKLSDELAKLDESIS